MATVRVDSVNGYDSSKFWVQSTGSSENERFETQTSAEGNVLLGERTETYEEFAFEAGTRTYNYNGEWTLRGENQETTSTVEASGVYDTIVVESAGGGSLASVIGLNFGVDFGSASGLPLLNVQQDINEIVEQALFGPAAPPNEAFENLHLAATPNLAALAFAGDDLVVGNVGFDTLYGFDGDDQLRGRDGDDILRGGGGRDTLIGGLGSDVLTGQDGADRFDYEFPAESGTTAATADRIVQFETGSDRINLHGMDADLTVVGNQAFDFLGVSNFTGNAGELRIRVTENDKTLIQGDLDGDRTVDFMVVLTEPMSLAVSDFVL